MGVFVVYDDFVRGASLGRRVFQWVRLHREHGFPATYDADNPVQVVRVEVHHGFEHLCGLCEFMGCALMVSGPNCAVVGRESNAVTVRDELRVGPVDVAAARRAFKAEWRSPRSQRAQDELEAALEILRAEEKVASRALTTPGAEDMRLGGILKNNSKRGLQV